MKQTDTKQTYRIKISLESRRLLDSKQRSLQQSTIIYADNRFVGQRPLLTRAPLSQYFHANYYDNRSVLLKEQHQWSFELLEHLTGVTLTSQQVASILQLAKEHDIEVKPLTANPKSTAGVLTFILSTFLDAVLQGNLVPTSPSAGQNP